MGERLQGVWSPFMGERERCHGIFSPVMEEGEHCQIFSPVMGEGEHCQGILSTFMVDRENCRGILYPVIRGREQCILSPIKRKITLSRHFVPVLGERERKAKTIVVLERTPNNQHMALSVFVS
jgi:hypothetical protein